MYKKITILIVLFTTSCLYSMGYRFVFFPHTKASDALFEIISGHADAPEIGREITKFKDEITTTHLTHAVSQNKIYAVVNILSLRPEIINTKDYLNNSPLNIAVIYSSSAEMVQLLVDQGADSEIRDSRGNKAIDFAIENNRVEMAEILRYSGLKKEWLKACVISSRIKHSAHSTGTNKLSKIKKSTDLL